MARSQPPALLYLLAVVIAMVNAQPPPPQPLTTPFSRTVSTVITVAISVFFFLVFCCVFVNQCRSAGAGAGALPGHGSPGSRRRYGLDPAVVAMMPIVPYTEIKKHKSALDCAVCLTAFEDGDDLRLLPQCAHAFHPDCINPWLEGHVTCPLCRANLEKPTAVVAPPSPQPEEQQQPQPQPPETVTGRADAASDDEERREEAVELELLRSQRRAARLPRSHSTGHSLFTSPSAEAGDRERFTLRLPPQVREEVLKSRRLRHTTSLVVGPADVSCVGSSMWGGGGGSSSHGARRWPPFLARKVSWARGEGSVRRGRDGAEPITKLTGVS